MNNINLRISKIAAVLPFIALPWAAEAATVSWHMSDSGAFEVAATFNDDGTGSVTRGAVTLNPGAKTGDIVAVYIQLRESALLHLPALQTIADGIDGSDITRRAIYTRDVQNGNIGDLYSIGLAIGTPGIGKDDIQSTAFLFDTPGLNLGDITGIAVRITSVGSLGGSRSDSLKLTGTTADRISGSLPGDATSSAVPEPASIALAGSALAAIGLLGRRRRQS